MKKHLQVLPKSLMAGAIGIILFIILLLILGAFAFSINLFGMDFEINANSLALLITILVTISTATHIYEISRLEKVEDERKKQLDLLKVLFEELNFLEKNLKSYKKSFSGEGYPLYELWHIDVSVYLKDLSHEINDQETINLKKNLMMIKDKILLINNFKNESKKLEEERGQERIIKEIGVIKMQRNQIVKIIDEIIPIIKNSEKTIVKILNQTPS